MSIYQIIQEIKSTRSRNEKEAILKREQSNEDLKTFFRLALNPMINFYQKKKFVQTYGGVFPLSIAMEQLESIIAGRVKTGNDAIAFITNSINALDEDDAKVIMHILQKESGCDLGGATINKIWKDLIPEFPCLLATAYDDKLAAKLNWTKGVISQTKSDGGRVTIVIDEEGAVSLFSRAGNELNTFGAFDFLGNTLKGVVLDGEMMAVKPDGKFADRQTGNGLFNKCVRGTLSETESLTLHITVWDIIPLSDFKAKSCQLEYSFRFAMLHEKVGPIACNKISIIPSRVVHSIAQAQDHYQEMIAAGEEGTMLKSQDMLWEDKRSKKQLKLKAIMTADLEVIGFKEGSGKITGNMGSLEMASSDRKVQVSMSGFSMKLRSEIAAKLMNKEIEYTMVVGEEIVTYTAKPGDSQIKLGSIVELLYNGKIKSRDSDVYSLFLPRFNCVRHDKTVANSEGEIK